MASPPGIRVMKPADDVHRGPRHSLTRERVPAEDDREQVEAGDLVDEGGQPAEQGVLDELDHLRGDRGREVPDPLQECARPLRQRRQRGRQVGQVRRLDRLPCRGEQRRAALSSRPQERGDLGVEPVGGLLQRAADPHLLEFLLLPDQQQEVLEDLDGGRLDLLAAQRVVVQDLLDQRPRLVLGEQVLGDTDQRLFDESP